MTEGLPGIEFSPEPTRVARKSTWLPAVAVQARSSTWYITTVVCVGIATDLLTYNIVIPVLPYRLQALGHDNISVLTSWLLFSYSAGILLSTLPIAYFFHIYPWRRLPLVLSVLVLEGALVLFMLVDAYGVMVFSRFLQGVSSATVWIVGFCLITENVDQKNVGRQLGYAVSGVSIGTVIAPPIGGALYQRMGWKAPFIFCIILLGADLIARLCVIEQKELPKYGYVRPNRVLVGGEKTVRTSTETKRRSPSPGQPLAGSAEEGLRQRRVSIVDQTVPVGGQAALDVPAAPLAIEADLGERHLSPWEIVKAIAKEPRGMTAMSVTFTFGLILGVLDPTVTLRIESVWHKDSAYVGLVYLAAAAPTFVSGPLIGALADKYGSEWFVAPFLFASMPFLPLLILDSDLAGFIVYFAFVNLLLSCALSPVSLELALCAQNMDGIGEIHQFAGMNLAFAISTAVGSVIGGQMYAHAPHGWAAVCWFCFGVTAPTVVASFFFTGNLTLFRRVFRRHSASDIPLDPQSTQNDRAVEGGATEATV